MIPIKNFAKGFFLATASCIFLGPIAEIVEYVTELVKTKISVKIGECNLELDKLSKELDTTSFDTIGFKPPTKDGEK